MGKIKSTLIKRTAEKLIQEKGTEFSTDFEKNKKILGETIPSKRMRNVIAGYITRLKGREKTASKQQKHI